MPLENRYPSAEFVLTVRVPERLSNALPFTGRDQTKLGAPVLWGPDDLRDTGNEPALAGGRPLGLQISPGNLALQNRRY